MINLFRAIEKPSYLIAILLVIPALVFVISSIKKTFASYAQDSSYKKPLKRFYLRCVCFSLAWIFLVLALAGISWGKSNVAVQKNGAAVCMVFDISHSMSATDAAGSKSRLKAAGIYASTLLEKMQGIKVSVVLVKGDGVLVMPLTQDFDALRILFDSMDPSYMTATGSSLGRGIMCAVRSFPVESAHSCNIWLFTDGEETDSMLESSLRESLKFGIPVTLIGFGSEQESEILAGDGKTRVRTALRSGKLKNLEKSLSYGEYSVSYVDSTEINSAGKILSKLKTKDFVAFESRPIERKNLFLILALIFFVAGIFICDFRIPILASCLVFSACSANFEQSSSILRGVFAYNSKNFPEATAYFLETAELAAIKGDTTVEQIAVYDLSATYLLQNQDEDAMRRLSAINSMAPDSVKFASFYNRGIIYYRAGDYARAADSFKQALLINPMSIDAKVNLELMQKQQQLESSARQQELSAASEEPEAAEPSLKSEIFSMIRKSEENQWQSGSGENSSSSGDDY